MSWFNYSWERILSCSLKNSLVCPTPKHSRHMSYGAIVYMSYGAIVYVWDIRSEVFLNLRERYA
jgi:hypothetical protein